MCCPTPVAIVIRDPGDGFAATERRWECLRTCSPPALTHILSGGQQAPTLVEEQVITWLKEMMGMPATSSGLLTSGGTMANLLGLGVARHAKAGFDVREEGLQGSHPRLLVYCSTEVHMWARKSMEFLGLGHQSLRQIPVDENYRIRIPDLAAQIAADRAAGFRPIAVLGTAGTVSTGAVDDLEGLAQLCRSRISGSTWTVRSARC